MPLGWARILVVEVLGAHVLEYLDMGYEIVRMMADSLGFAGRMGKTGTLSLLVGYMGGGE